MTQLITRQALNRATLERQLLLDRSNVSVTAAVEHLVGLQAQTPHTWYVGLWTRLVGFLPEHAADLLIARQLVRIALMRGTIHLVTAADCLELRPLLQPLLDRWLRTQFGKNLVGVDRNELVAAARALIDEHPLTFATLGARLAQGWPGHDPASLAQAVRGWVPLVQVPPRGVWGRSGPIAHTSAESWLGAALSTAPSSRAMILRYLGAFGPATVRDMQTWSGLTGLGEVVEAELRSALVTFRDEHGRELFDLPDAPRPDPDKPAPPRFLYDYDNLLLSHADRGRVVTDDYRRQVYDPNGPMPAIVLLDGFTSGDWRITRQRGAATLSIRPFIHLSKQAAAAIESEGGHLLEFVAPDAQTRDIQILPTQ